MYGLFVCTYCMYFYYLYGERLYMCLWAYRRKKRREDIACHATPMIDNEFVWRIHERP